MSEPKMFDPAFQDIPAILVCVTDQVSCARIVHAGAEEAKRANIPLRVVSVRPKGQSGQPHNEALEYLFLLSRQAGAEMTIYYHDHPDRLLCQIIESQKIARILIGGNCDPDQNAFAKFLASRFENIPVDVVGAHGQLHPMALRNFAPQKGDMMRVQPEG